MLESSAAYLGGIVSTTISGANMAASESAFLALGSFPAEALTEPLMMMFKTPFAEKKLTLEARIDGTVTLVSDKPLLMRALANLLSNSYQYSESGGARIEEEREGELAIITRDRKSTRLNSS